MDYWIIAIDKLKKRYYNNYRKGKKEVKIMRYKIYVNGKFVGYGHAVDVMITELENPGSKVTCEKC